MNGQEASVGSEDEMKDQARLGRDSRLYIFLIYFPKEQGMRCESAHFNYNNTEVPKQTTTMFYVALANLTKEPLLNARTTAPHVCELVREGCVCVLKSYRKVWTGMGHHQPSR